MPDNSNIASNFSNLPMDQLISAPLKAAADSNVKLAVATYDFINNVWLDKEGGTTRQLKFNIDRKDQTGKDLNYAVNAPFAALVQTPNLMIDSVDIDFTMEVKDTVSTSTENDATASFDGSANYLFFSVHVSGSVTSKSTNTRQSDQSAKYDVRVHAGQAQVTEGMNRLAQLFASTIEPVKLGTS